MLKDSDNFDKILYGVLFKKNCDIIIPNDSF